MKAGTIEIELLANMARLVKDMEQAKRTVGDAMTHIEKAAGVARNALGALGVALSVGAIVSFSRGVINAIDALNDLKDATGASIEKLSSLDSVARRNGHTFEGWSGSLVRFNKVLADAKPGSGPELTLKAIGLSAKQLRELDPAEALQKVAIELQKYADDGNKARIIQELFSKSVKEAAPFLKDLAEAGALNAKVTTAQAEEAERFNKQLFEMKANAVDAQRTLMVDFVPVLNEMLRIYVALGEERGGLWSFFKSGGAARDVQNPAAKVGELQEKLAALLRTKREIEQSAANKTPLAAIPLFGTKFDLGVLATQISEVNKQIELFQRLDQKALAKAGGAGAALEEMFNLGGSPNLRKSIGGVPDTDAIRAASKELEAQRKIILQLAGIQPDFIEDWNRLNRMYAGGALTLEQLTQLQADLLGQQPAIKKAKEEELALAKAIYEFQQQFADDVAQAAVAESKAREQVGIAITEQYAALRDANEQLALERNLLGASDKERAIGVELLRIEQQLRRQIADLEKNTAYSPAQRELERQRFEDIAAEQKRFAVSKANLQEQVDLLQVMERTAHDVWTNIWEGGSNVFKRLGQTLKASLLDLLYQMTVKKWILSIGASVTGGGLTGAAATGAVQGGVSAGVGGLFAGTSFGGFGAGLGATMQNGIFSGFGANMANIGGMLQGGSYGMALGSAMPYIGMALAAISLLKGQFKGETRSGASYEVDPLTGAALKTQGPSGGELSGDQTRAAIEATYKGINDTLKSLGSAATISQLVAGLESSERGKAFVFGGGTLSTGATFGNYLGRDGVDPMGNLTGEQALQRFAVEMKTTTLQALQAADIQGVWGEYLRGLGDISKMTESQLDASLGRITKALTEKATLEDRLFNLTATDAEKLARVRDAERAAVDSTNLALLEEIYRHEDLQAAAEKAGEAIRDATDALVHLEDVQSLFMTKEEQRYATALQIATQLKAAGLDINVEQVLSATRQQFRDLYLEVVAMGPAGETLAQALLQVAAAFASITPEIDALSDVQVAAQERLDEAKQVLIAAYQREASMLEQTISRLQDFARNIRDFRDSLLVGDLSPLTPSQQYAQALAQLQTVAAAAGAGDANAQGQLQGLAQQFLQISREFHGATDMYARDFQMVQRLLTNTAGRADQQLEVARRQLEVANRQLERLGVINNSVLSVADALAAYNRAIREAVQAGLEPDVRVPGGNPRVPVIGGGAGSAMAGSNPRAPLMPGLPAFAAGGRHAGGWALVGERGPEFAYMPPAHIYTAQETMSMRYAGGVGMPEISGWLQQLVARMESLERTLAAGEAGNIAATRENTQAVRTSARAGRADAENQAKLAARSKVRA